MFIFILEWGLITSLIEYKEVVMAKKVTSPKVASKASGVLRDKRTSKKSKSAAGSALSQREKRGKR